MHKKILETQISQVAQQQATIVAPTGVFHGTTTTKPKGACQHTHAAKGNKIG